MYRHNQLKEELDRLREENTRLKCENIYLETLVGTLKEEIRAMKLETQVKEMGSRLGLLTKPQPVVLNVSSKEQSNFLKGLNTPGQIITPPEPFETGIKLGVLKEEEEEENKKGDK